MGFGPVDRGLANQRVRVLNTTLAKCRGAQPAKRTLVGLGQSQLSYFISTFCFAHERPSRRNRRLPCRRWRGKAVLDILSVWHSNYLQSRTDDKEVLPLKMLRRRAWWAVLDDAQRCALISYELLHWVNYAKIDRFPGHLEDPPSRYLVVLGDAVRDDQM